MAEQGFPLPGSSYKELVKIIQGYGAVQQSVPPAEVAKVIGMNETIVSRNNKFLVAAGIVQGGKKKSITPLGSELAHALHYDLPDEIAAKWRAVVDTTEFLQKVVAAVRIRKGMDEPSLESHVAYSAGQPKTPIVAAGAGAVVEILKRSGWLKEDGGNLIAASPEPQPSQEPTQISVQVGDEMRQADAVSILPVPPHGRASGIPGAVQLSIEVRVQCTPQDLDGLGQKLRKVLAEFNQPQPEDAAARLTSTAGETVADKEVE